MIDKLEKIKKEALESLSEAGVMDELVSLKVKYLGKKGELTAILKSMKDVAPEERPKVGQLVNDARSEIENALEARK